MTEFRLEASTMTADEFRILREGIGSQEEVAGDLGCNRRSIGRWERGERAIPQKAVDRLKVVSDQAKARRTATAAAVKGMNAAEPVAVTGGTAIRPIGE